MPRHGTQLPEHMVALLAQDQGADKGVNGFCRAALGVITRAAQGQFEGHFQFRLWLRRDVQQHEGFAHIVAVLLEQRQFLPQWCGVCGQTDGQRLGAITVQAPVQHPTHIIQAASVTLDPAACGH